MPQTRPALRSASAFVRSSGAPLLASALPGAAAPGPGPQSPPSRPAGRRLPSPGAFPAQRRACPSPYLLQPPRSLPPSLAFDLGPPKLRFPTDPPRARPWAISLQIRPDPHKHAPLPRPPGRWRMGEKGREAREHSAEMPVGSPSGAPHNPEPRGVGCAWGPPKPPNDPTPTSTAPPTVLWPCQAHFWLSS